MAEQLEMIEVSIDFFRWFLIWAQGLERDVCMISDPPIENFNDFSDGDVWPESVVATSILQDDRSGPDPRPLTQRSTMWWREKTKIRADWLARFNK